MLVCHFCQKTWKRGDLFPILTTKDSSIFLSNLVNHGQGLMCLKFKPLFLYKQHPIVHYHLILLFCTDFIISIFVSLALSTHPSKVLNVFQQSQWGLPHVQIKPVCLEGPGENFAFDLVEGSLGAGLNVGLQDSLSR